MSKGTYLVQEETIIDLEHSHGESQLPQAIDMFKGIQSWPTSHLRSETAMTCASEIFCLNFLLSIVEGVDIYEIPQSCKLRMGMYKDLQGCELQIVIISERL